MRPPPARTHALHLRPLPPGWSSHLLRLAYERAEIPALALHRIMHLRLLHSQDHPPGYGGVTCPFCHRPYPDSRRPPPAPLPPRLRPAVTPRVAPVHAPAHHGSHCRPLTPPRHPFRAPHGHHRSVPLRAPPSRPATRPPPTQLGFSLLGMWHSSSLHGAPPLLDSAGREELLRELLSTLSTTHTSLASLLRRAPSHVTDPPPPPPRRTSPRRPAPSPTHCATASP